MLNLLFVVVEFCCFLDSRFSSSSPDALCFRQDSFSSNFGAFLWAPCASFSLDYYCHKLCHKSHFAVVSLSLPSYFDVLDSLHCTKKIAIVIHALPHDHDAGPNCTEYSVNKNFFFDRVKRHKRNESSGEKQPTSGQSIVTRPVSSKISE